MNSQEFVSKWRGVELKERSFYQEHFLDLCRLVGHESPADIDPTGEHFTFEAGAGRGFADVWKKGFFAWEYKGSRRDFEDAYDQLLRYRESLRNPPLLIVADAHLIRIHTNFTNSVKREYEINLDDLLQPESLEIIRCAFFEPNRLRAAETPEQVTEKAATEFAQLAEMLRKSYKDSTQIAHFLIRLLFCLFAEDIGLLPQDLFTRLVARTRRDSQAFTTQLRQLFGAMSTGGWFGVDEIPHFDGGLFDDDFVLEIDNDGIDILSSVSGLDWSSIEPSILGTLFERSLNPGKRAQLGAHYTSREDILLIVEPVLMAPFRRRWIEVEEQAREIAARRDSANTPRRKQNRTKDLIRFIEEFTKEIQGVQILDPACGSGNFLYVALRQLLELWREVSNLGSELSLPLMLPTSAPSPEQLFGIEINTYAHELAQAPIWIGYIQWLRENGFGKPPEPILKKLSNIHRMDAILAYDEDGNPVTPEWPKTDVLIGNPPFLGGKWLRKELGDYYVDDLFKLYEGRVPRQSDLVCYWFKIACSLITNNDLERAGLLATQNIRSGQNRVVLDHIIENGQVFMAWSDREWVLDGADVRVSMIGFDNGIEKEICLDGKEVNQIHSNLTSGVDTTQAFKLTENSGICLRTDEKGGPFDIPEDLAMEMLSAPLNVNGQPNSEVIVPWISGRDVMGRSRNRWIIDFGIDMPIEDASQFEIPFKYVEEIVKPERINNRIARFREKWWIHRGPGISMREARERLNDKYIVTLRVSKHPIFIFLDKQYLPDVRLIFFAREDDYFFGVLQSKVHVTWYLSTGTRHGVGNDPTYIPTRTFKTFPFPWPPGFEPVNSPDFTAISKFARDLDDKRELWLKPENAVEEDLKARTLTNLYNQRPTWLDLAHQKLDNAVLDAYGWPHDLSANEILERLLDLNHDRAKKQDT